MLCIHTHSLLECCEVNCKLSKRSRDIQELLGLLLLFLIILALINTQSKLSLLLHLIDYMMLVLVTFMLCMRSFLMGGLTLGLEEDANMTNVQSCIEEERQTLLVFKADLVDDNNNLYDWGSEEDKRDCCKWTGVRCDNHTGHVIGIDLSTSFDGLAGKISPSLPELNQLQYLNLNGIDFQSNRIPNLLGSLTNLKRLDISNANLSGTIPYQLANLSNLRHLDLSRNFLVGSIPTSIRDLTSLTYLDLSVNQLGGVIPKYFGTFAFLVQLNLSENFLSGLVPNFAGCSSMKELILHRNSLSGRIPDFAGCSSLSNLSLGHNAFNGRIPEFTGCSSLSNLFLGHNALTGNIPDFTAYPSLRMLDLSNNRLSGNLPKNVGQVSNLEYLDLSSNFLNGVISEAHFLNLTQLTYLDLSFNSVALDLSSGGRISFQLWTIKLQSCKLGPSFPIWIQTQRKFLHLDISSAGISDSIPAWFWDLPPVLKFLNISSNEIKGTLPEWTTDFVAYAGIDLSYNHLEGRVPLLPSKLAALNLSGNKFSGTLSFLCQIDAFLSFIDLSNNLLSGSLPDCWLKFQKHLVVLNLSNNNLSGKIPSSLGLLSHLEALYLRKNAFVGELPMSLSNCRKLRFADLGQNKLSGNIPAWIGESLQKLYLLVLRSNRFYGSLPSQICWLNNLQFLDLSKNGISGSIPRCFGNLTAMVRRGLPDEISNHSYYIAVFLGPNAYDLEFVSYLPHGLLNDNMIECMVRGSSYLKCLAEQHYYIEEALYNDHALVTWKGSERKFESGLPLLKSIDLSSNNLSGRLPYEITGFHELVSLNISFNKLHGEVPKHIGRLKSLESFDLSWNKFSGTIPPSLSQIASLSYLDLSNNDFSGRIPTGTQLQGFNASFYAGNPRLCGAPLTPRCGLPAATFVMKEDDEEDEADFWKPYYMGMGTGFGVGFWAICGALFLNRWFRHFFFASLSHLKDLIFVAVAVHLRKLQRKFRRGVLRS